MKNHAAPTPPHRRPSGSWDPVPFPLEGESLDPSFRWGDARQVQITLHVMKPWELHA